MRRSRLVLRLVAVVWVKWRLFSESGLIYHTYGGAGDSALPRFSLPAATNRCRYGLGQSWRGGCDDRCEWNASAPLWVRIVPRNGGLGRRVGRGRGGEAGIAPQGRRRGGSGEGAARNTIPLPADERMSLKTARQVSTQERRAKRGFGREG